MAIALLALFASRVAWSQSAPGASNAAAELSSKDVILAPVTVHGTADNNDFGAATTSLGKLPADLHDVPQSVTVVNKALMQSQGTTSLTDALRNVPGITLGGAEGGQIGNNINLNGFSARTDIYLDGFRDRGQYYRDTFALDEVEVLMGPSSMLFGRGSTGGVINQSTKKPALKSIAEVSGSITTNGLARTTVDDNHPVSADSAYRVAAMAQDGSPSTRDGTRIKDFGLAPSFKTGIGTPTEITLSTLFQHNDDKPDYGVSPLNGHPVDVNRDTFYGFTDDHTTQDIAAVSALVKHKISPDTSLRNQTQFNFVETNARETASNTIGTVDGTGFHTLPISAVSTLPLTALSVRLQSHDRKIKDSSLFNQTELATKFPSGPLKHSVLLGAEIGYDKYNNHAYYRNGTCNGVALNPVGGTSGYVACEPLVNPTYLPSPSNVSSSTGNRATGSATTIAGYFNDTVELNPQVKLVGGLRYDRYDADITNSINSTNTAGNTSLARTNQTVYMPSVRAGTIWQPTLAQSYYFSYSTSFNPSLEQLISTTGISQPLGPEKNKSYETGGKWDVLDGNLSLNSALFQITQYNSRSQNSDGTFTANGTIRVDGLRLGAVGHITNTWQVFMGFTHLNATIVDAIAAGTMGMVPSNTPRNSTAIWTTYNFTRDWEVGGGATHLSKRYLNNTDTVEVDGYTRYDATVAYIQKTYDIRFNLFNVTDKHYYDALIQSDGGRAVPGSGRTGMITVTYRM
ncbi:MAG TPA: TonB-dependent siderophore receptor [Rhodocyclaceae bacterium]|nr:TonB-dependent siderophore receptor [Rhodocyclaceae bacterium]